MGANARTQGWSPGEIKSRLHLRGWTFRKIGQLYGYKDPRTPGDVIRRPWPLMEQVVAQLLGVPQAEIWPERYRSNGKPAGAGVRGQYSKSGNSDKRTVDADPDTAVPIAHTVRAAAVAIQRAKDGP